MRNLRSKGRGRMAVRFVPAKLSASQKILIVAGVVLVVGVVYSYLFGIPDFVTNFFANPVFPEVEPVE